jgi:uncharacterized protein YebE (UPF0316 family)
MRISVKKTLGSIGTVIIYFLSIYAVLNKLDTINNVLWPLITFVAALFGIKTFGGLATNKEEKK